jgi:hypothetical protein
MKEPTHRPLSENEAFAYFTIKAAARLVADPEPFVTFTT